MGYFHIALCLDVPFPEVIQTVTRARAIIVPVDVELKDWLETLTDFSVQTPRSASLFSHSLFLRADKFARPISS